MSHHSLTFNQFQRVYMEKNSIELRATVIDIKKDSFYIFSTVK